MSIKVNADNYDTYKQVFEIIMRHISKLGEDFNERLSADTYPVTVLKNWEAQSKSLARRGLQAGLNDLLFWLRDLPAATIQDINAELEKNNLPNLKVLTGSIQKSIKRVLKTKKIQNLDQYDIVKELLDDTTSEITNEDRNTLNACLFDFEQAANR